MNMKLFKKKKKDEVLVWDREEEYQRAKTRMVDAEIAYIECKDKGEEKENLKTAWLEAKKIFEPLYCQREDWFDKNSVRPKRDRISKDAKLAAGVTILGIGLPPLIENRGVIMRHAREWIQKPKLWRK